MNLIPRDIALSASRMRKTSVSVAPCVQSLARILPSRFTVNKVLLQGNKIIGEAAIRAGCRFYAGYPITPQNELPEYMAENIRKVEGGVFIQSESEIAAIHMIIGAVSYTHLTLPTILRV